MSTAPAVNMLKRVARINQPVKTLEKNKWKLREVESEKIRAS